MKPRRPHPGRIATAAALLLAVSALSTGCLQLSGDTWMIRSAATPEGWPAPTPVGEVVVQDYPAHRAAVVTERDLADEDSDGMFMELFRHIRRNDIAMTAPVEMTYDDPTSESPRVDSMTFLYRSAGIGRVGADGKVSVRDVESRTFASLGVRGGYTERRFRRSVELLETWLAENGAEWESAGPPRYLGYNSPFVPPFMRFGEVQVPVRPAGARDLSDGESLSLSTR
jgi:hypothetical protein